MGHHRTTLRVGLPEWSIDAVGWLVALAAEACRTVGVDSGVLMDVVPDGAL